jgi:hypothetical protein
VVTVVTDSPPTHLLQPKDPNTHGKNGEYHQDRLELDHDTLFASIDVVLLTCTHHEPDTPSTRALD